MRATPPFLSLMRHRGGVDGPTDGPPTPLRCGEVALTTVIPAGRHQAANKPGPSHRPQTENYPRETPTEAATTRTLIQSGSFGFWAMSRTFLAPALRCQLLPKGHTPVLFPLGQSVFCLSPTVGLWRGLTASCFPLFFACGKKPVPARAYRGENWEPVCFPQGKPLNSLKLTGSRFFLFFGYRLKNGNRFWEAYLRLLFAPASRYRQGSTTPSVCPSGAVGAARPPACGSRRRRWCRTGPRCYLSARRSKSQVLRVAGPRESLAQGNRGPLSQPDRSEILGLPTTSQEKRPSERSRIAQELFGGYWCTPVAGKTQPAPLGSQILGVLDGDHDSANRFQTEVDAIAFWPSLSGWA